MARKKQKVRSLNSEQKEDQEKTYGDWASKLGTGEVQKTDDGFCAVVQIGNSATTPEPFDTFEDAEEWVKEQIEAE